MIWKNRKVARKWVRLYSFSFKRDLRFIRYKSGPLVPDSGIGNIRKTLWGYFNAPGNKLFVTTNVVSFIGIVTYNTLVNNNVHDRLFEERLLASNYEVIRNRMSVLDELNDKKFKSLENELQQKVEELSKISSGLVETKNPNVPTTTSENYNTSPDGPINTYSTKQFSKVPLGKMASNNSTLAKASLFHMFYAFQLYESVINEEFQLMNETSWNNEVIKLYKDNKEILAGASENMHLFYSLWRDDSNQIFTDFGSTKNFQLPNWNTYPRNLQNICKELHSNNLESIENFDRLYSRITDIQLKQLVRLWFYDNTRLFRSSSDWKFNEKLYVKILHDCCNDPNLYRKYASIVLNPKNPRNESFFERNSMYPSTRYIHLSTLIDVLQGYVLLRENSRSANDYNLELLRIVHMLKTHGTTVNNKNNFQNPDVRILLDDVKMRPQEQNNCFDQLRNNTRLLELLQSISQENKQQQ